MSNTLVTGSRVSASHVAAHNSSSEILRLSRVGATRVLAHNRMVVRLPLRCSMQAYMQVAYALALASANPCSSIDDSIL